MVAMRDGVKLSGDLYIPAIDGRVDPHRRWPCVLVRTPYNKSSVNPDFRNPGIYWTQNGYVEIQAKVFNIYAYNIPYQIINAYARSMHMEMAIDVGVDN